MTGVAVEKGLLGCGSWWDVSTAVRKSFLRGLETWAMHAPGDRAIIKAEIERLQKAQSECNDGGIQKKIDVWIEEQKQKLALRRLFTLPHLRQALSAGRMRHGTRPLDAQKVLPRL